MRYVLVCPDEFLLDLVPPRALHGISPVYVVETPGARVRVVRRGGSAIVGDLESEAVYRRVFRTGLEPVIVAVAAPRHRAVIATLRAVAPAAPVLLLAEEGVSTDGFTGVARVAPSSFAERVVQPEIERAATRTRVDRLRRHFARADRLLIMLQDDPDPDAIASALALKVLLGRNRAAATIATFGTITRPENRAMARILDIEVEEIKARAVDEFDMVAMVDTQPSFFEERFGQVDLVIDHHPEETPARAHLKDIRPSYGATSTIMTEYLRAADAKFTARLATALLYGIKADTLYLERGSTRADMEAFAFLHRHANHSALRRIERPELPDSALDILALGIARRHVVHGVVFSHLGGVGYPELVAQFADLFLQVEGAEWSVVSGTVNGELHISVRNVGYVKAAGEVVRRAFGDLGSAGGHRSMAKAVIRLRDWRARAGDTGNDALGQAIVARFLRAVRA